MSFYVTGGSLQYDAPSYVERQADRDLLRGLLDGEFCYVLTARQMGKSSLMVRTANRLREAGVKVAALDLTAIGGQNVSPEQCYTGPFDMLGQALDLEDEFEIFWQANSQLGPLHRLMKALRQIVLGRLAAEANDDETPHEHSAIGNSSFDRSASRVRLVVFVDEIDFVRSLPFSTDEFFAAIRQCYNHRTLDPAYQRLTFCLLGVASPSDLISDTRTTPFNIGRRIELNDFTDEEAAPLAVGLQVGPSPKAAEHAPELLARILYWTEGHPYLTQKLCRFTAETLRANDEVPQESAIAPSAFIDGVCADLFFSHRARERDDNLIFVRERLLRDETDRAGLLDLYLKVWRGKRVMDDELDPLITTLRLSGVVRVSEGRLRERNRIYGRVFDPKWVRANMPEAELRRQREAFQRGVVLTTAISIFVLAVIASLVILAITKSNDARIASALKYFSQAKAERMNGRVGQRLNSLRALEEARRNYPKRLVPDTGTELRDEAVSCLALIDLRPETNQFSVPSDSVSFLRTDNFDCFATGDSQGTIRVYPGKGALEPRLLPGMGVGAGQMRFSRDHRWLAVEHRNDATNFVVVWDWAAGRRLFTVNHEVSHRALDFTSQGERLLIGRTNGTIVFYSVPDGNIERILTQFAPKDVRRPLVLRTHPTTNWVAIASTGDQVVRVWKLESPQAESVTFYHGDLVRDLAWHPHGHTLATACDNQLVYLWAADSSQNQERTLSGHEDIVLSVAFSHRGDLLASSGADRTVRIWTTPTQRQLTLFHENPTFMDLQFSADDRYLEGAGERRQVWELVGSEYRLLEWKAGPAEELKSIDFSSDNKLLVAASNDRVMLWDPWSALLLRQVLTTSPTHSAVFKPGAGEILVSQNRGLGRQCVRLGGNLQETSMEPELDLYLDLSFNQLGNLVLSTKSHWGAVAQQSHVSIFDIAQPTNQFLLDGGVRYERLAISPDGKWLAALPAVILGEEIHPSEKSLHLWNLETRRRETLALDVSSSRFFAFSPDSTWLIVCTRGVYVFYEVGTWQAAPNLSISRREGTAQNAPLAFSQDSDLLAVADSRYSIRLFRFRKGQSGPLVLVPIAHLEAPDRSPLLSLSLSPNGEILATTTQARLIQVWNLAAIARSLGHLGLGTL